jgi:predicted ATPase/signal transduction histidine kinase
MLEGTLNYMSPEQTGRMNREIDYRTDFYSLGVTLYRLFTHELPFKTFDPMELVHAHIAKTPDAPHTIAPQVPEQVSHIIMKLLTKKPEERYSSALSLLHDLERCVEEWKATGRIDPFPLGLTDISHKLQISQKLYGREKELKQLLQVFNEVCEGSTQMFLLAGYPGIGKSSIVHEIHRPLLERKSFFISGKYDQYKANIPYSAILEAFQDLIQQILTENDDVIAMWRERLKMALGNNVGVITEVVPELKFIIGERAAAQEFDSQETQNRFNFFFQRFISLYATPDTPLVIFLDDLQWIDPASLQLIELVMTRLKTKGLLLIGAYRNNEVTSLHPLLTFVQRINRSGGQITTIEILPLSMKSVHQIIADSLHLSLEKTQSLCTIVYNKTHGNPFFINQFLTYLYEEKLLHVDPKEGIWTWDPERIQALDVSDNVVDLLIAKLQKCSVETQEILEVAACIGSHFDPHLLAKITDKPLKYVMTHLMEAIKEGFILPSDDFHLLMQAPETSEEQRRERVHIFRFLHDKVQQAAYQLMNESQRKSTHYKIGLSLLKKYNQEELEEHIFEVMAQLNHTEDLISEPKERKTYAEMNLIAAQKAMRTVAYRTALDFLNVGLNFLPSNRWSAEYPLTFQLTFLAAEANYLLFRFDEASRLFDHILEFAQSVQDKIAVCTLKVKLYISSANYKEAIRWARTGLKLYNIHIPSKYLKLHLLKEFLILRWKLLGKDIESLVSLPTISDPDQLNIIQLFQLLITPSYLSSKDLFAFVVMKGLNMTLKFGNAPMTGYMYAGYGIIMNAVFEDFKTSFAFGNLALEVNRKFDDQRYMPATKFLVGTFLNPTQNHLRTSVPILQAGFEMGTSTGDFINAVFCQGMMFTDKYLSGYNIKELSEEVKECLEYVAKIKSHNRGYVFNALRQVFMALTGKTYNPSTMQTDDFNEEAFLQMLRDNNFLITLYFAYTFKMQLCYLFENYELAIAIAEKAEELTFCVIGQPMRLENDFYHALSLAANYAWKDHATQEKYLKKIHSILRRLRNWANAVPVNYRHKYLLVRAELARIEGDKETAVEMYDQAIESAKENSYIQAEGVANELFAKFYLAQNRPYIAKQYLMDAHYAFYRWGASAKAAQLEKKYGASYPSFLEQELRAIPSGEVVFEGVKGSSALDSLAVIKATQAISGEIVLNRLLDQLMRIVVETAGAEKAMLILENEGRWLIEAEYSIALGNRTLRPSIPYKERKDALSTMIVNYVLRTKEQVSLDDASRSSMFFADPYIVAKKPQSVLCFPLLHQAKLIGVLYLENNLTTRAFTPQRVEILKLLTNQISTSLENAMLYTHQAELSDELKVSNEKLADYSHNLEKKVYDRTRELNEKNKQLEETLGQIKEMQKKLIQQEKLVSMAAVTKSIAAEMRNPLNYIDNFSSLSQNLIDEIKEASSIPKMKEPLELIEINLKKINEHSRKADEIITSMLQQSRESERQKEPTDINKLIRDYADLVYYTYYKRDPLFSLTIETHYDDTIGKINVFPQNMGRVFYNIIDNACYATDLKKKELGGNFSPIVSISTENGEESVTIKVRDNGAGIPPDILSRVFSPFLTTKPADKGAGMGLSISHDIVVEDHGGKINIQSEEGQFTEVTISLPKF